MWHHEVIKRAEKALKILLASEKCRTQNLQVFEMFRKFLLFLRLVSA